MLRCIFLAGKDKRCDAALYATAWNVDEETLKKLCDTDQFHSCARYLAYMEYLQNSTTLKFKEK